MLTDLSGAGEKYRWVCPLSATLVSLEMLVLIMIQEVQNNNLWSDSQ